MDKKWKYILGIAMLCFFMIGFLFLFGKEEVTNQTSTDIENIQMTIMVDTLDFRRKSKIEIELVWSDEHDLLVDTYILKKRIATEVVGTGEWQIVDTIKSDGVIDNKEWSVIDTLDDMTPQQFEYRVDVELAIIEAVEQTSEEYIGDYGVDEKEVDREKIIFEPAEGKSILASNVKICIDPGHFHKPGEVTEADEYAYVEGDFMLEVALELQEQLKCRYGIDSCLTRDSATITLGGYTDEELDSAHISLRGEYAAEEDCDLFVSLHSNSNAEEANGYETFSQPLAINKPIIIVNTIALTSENAMRSANATGVKLASVNYELGLSNTSEFEEVSLDDIGEWTQEYNDGLNQMGTVVIRTGKKNPDYYGVLRGATNVEIPGMIIEHGFHSVAEVRKAAAVGDLKEVWANADACGIAYGFGFTK